MKPNFEVYLSIEATGEVTLWQRISTFTWECFTATAATEDGVIGGTYSDGAAWSSTYYYEVSAEVMIWTDTLDSNETATYERCTLPDNLTKTRSDNNCTNVERYL